MQVFMYCWMYAHLTENKGKTIQPGIYYVRSLFADPFDHRSTTVSNGGSRRRVEDFSGYAQAFEEGLRGCLDEIFNPEIPFTQTPTGKACSYCPFKGIAVSSICPGTSGRVPEYSLRSTVVFLRRVLEYSLQSTAVPLRQYYSTS